MNESLISSQSFRTATSAGTPMRVRRVASCVIVPPYCTPRVTVVAGATSFGKVTIASDRLPVWSMSEV